MPPDTSDAHEAALRAAVENGSAAAGHELGLVLTARGDPAGAYEAWTRAAEDGSADAAYLVAWADYRRDGDLDAYVTGARSADAGGSLFAAVALAALDEAAAPGEGPLWRRALGRASSRDAAGSADAAVVLAQLHEARGEHADAVRAWERAERRGAPAATVGLVGALLARGDAPGAEAAARRGEAAGVPAASVLLAGLLQQRQAWKESHRALLRAVERGGELGDWETVTAVTTVLDPFARVRLARYRGVGVGVAVGLVLHGGLAGWPWAVAALATLVAVVLAAKPALRGMPVWIDGADDTAVSLLGVSLSGRLAMVEPGPRRSDQVRRPATARDVTFWRLLVATVVVVALATWPWAAGWWTGSTLGRVALGGAAVALALAAAWRWLEDVPVATVPRSDRGEPGVEVLVGFSPLPFLTAHARLAVTNPALLPVVVAATRGAGDRAGPRGVLARTAEAAPAATVAVTLAVLAVAPDQGRAAGTVLAVAVAVLEVVVVLAGLVAAAGRAYRGVRLRQGVDLAVALAYVLAVAAVVAVAMWLDLDAGLVRALTDRG
ncbi:tetratricopeptide repeat protein [Actinotalea solisilvae]|uniref:tetratricopeptide repeat protein n=1 Tax=Actinotalea solisilvae TaxID=2072922 RepID=UPI0018F15784|nr:hypothetical protein [Actinotalea solisilvae]